jgi:hypothetical protein
MIMATSLENAIFAYDAYATSDENELPQLPGWTKNSELSQPGSDGFAASVYVNGTNEVVISFRGTDSDDLVPFIADWWEGNIPAALGNYSAQVAQAIARVADVEAQYPGASLSFTGHSLGGGLASLMAVFFDRPAYVFDPAPFGLTAPYAQCACNVSGYDAGRAVLESPRTLLRGRRSVRRVTRAHSRTRAAQHRTARRQISRRIGRLFSSRARRFERTICRLRLSPA